MRIIDTQKRDVQTLTNIEPTQRMFRSILPNLGTSITPSASGIAFFVYVGRTTLAMIPKFIEFWLEAGGSGTPHTAEIGLFSTPSAPGRNDQTLTKLTASTLAQSGTEDLIAASPWRLVRRNNSAYTYTVPAGTHLWAGIRTALATNQPNLGGLCQDFSYGLVLATSPGATAFNTGTTWNASRIAVGTYLGTAIAPDLRVTLD